ncbi:unnamed protein product [Amaranthus hypochondriacus]
MDSGALNIHQCRNIVMSSFIAIPLYPLTSFPRTLNCDNPLARRCSPFKLVCAANTRTPRSISRSVRDAAIKKLQQSSDLNYALSRYEGILMVPDLNIILRNLGRSRRWKDLSQLFEWMQKHGKINAASYSSYIKFMGESKDILKALNVYNNINDEDMKNHISICNSVLSCLVKNNISDRAMSMFDEMKQNGLRPDVVTYSTLLAGCVKVKRGYMKAQELIKEMEHNEILMDAVTYGTVIALCASNGRCEEADMYFIRMQAEGLSPNMYHYSSLLNAYAVDGDYKKADKLVQDMQSARLLPNKVIWTTLLKVYVRGGLFEKSSSLLSKLESLGFADDEMPYCILMDGLSKSGKVDEAKSIFDRMNERRVRSDGYSYSIMIAAFCRAGHLKEAKKLASNYEALCNKYDLIILNALLCAYCRASDMECVMQTLGKMDKLAITPDKYTFNILIKYFCKEKLYLLAYRTLEDMRNKGHQLEEEVLSSLLLQLGETGAHSEAFSVYKILISSEKTISSSLHENILHILIAGMDLDNAFAVVKEHAKFISSKGLKKFLGVFLRSGNINSIYDVVDVIHGSGHKIDQDLFQLVISRYITKLEKEPENTETLVGFLRWMQSHGYMIEQSTRNLILKNINLRKHPFVAEMLAKPYAIRRAS